MEARISPSTANTGDKLQPEFSCRSGEHIAAVSQSAYFSKDKMRKFAMMTCHASHHAVYHLQ